MTTDSLMSIECQIPLTTNTQRHKGVRVMSLAEKHCIALTMRISQSSSTHDVAWLHALNTNLLMS